MNRLTETTLVFIGVILILAGAAAGVLLKFHEARLDAAQAGAMIDAVDVDMAEVVNIGEGSLCKLIFREPFESVVFLFRDGSFVVFSTGHDKAIAVPASWLLDYIRETGRDIKDCLLVVHNHFAPTGFSESDLQTWHYLVRNGFTGVFGIYYPASGRFRAAGD